MAFFSNLLKDQITASPAGRRSWNRAAAYLDMTERICEVMQQNGVTRKRLAKRLGIKKRKLNKILDSFNDNRRFRFSMMCDIFTALGQEIAIGSRPYDLIDL